MEHKKTPFFSVIVPIYKTEKYLSQCVDSILGQTFTDFEVILVDDGSPDQCPALCDGYAKMDSRIQVIHRENRGLVSARQEGLCQTSGEYILNVDSDDWIPEDLLEESYRILSEHPADMIVFALSYEYKTHARKSKEAVPEGLYSRTEIENKVFPKLLMDRNMKHLHNNFGGKVIRRSLLLEHQLAVDPQITLGEDLLCILSVYQEARWVYISSKTGSFYRQHETSMTKTMDFITSQREMKLMMQLEDKKYTQIQGFDEQLDRYAAALIFWILIELSVKEESGQLENLKMYLNYPVFQRHIKKAQFGKLTKKTQITMNLLRKNHLKSAYHFLVLCRKIKQR